MKRFLAGWGAVLLAYQLPLSAETLTVQVSGIKDPGEIHIAIYDSAEAFEGDKGEKGGPCLLYTSPSPRDATLSRMPSSA